MDIVFHTTAAVVLAKQLGENRKSALAWAAIAGLNPDFITFFGMNVLPGGMSYSIGHSLFTQAAICLMIFLVNRKIAFGGMLHIGLDVITHSYSTRHILYPFCSYRIFTGTNWYHRDGIWIWAMLWTILLLVIYHEHRAAKTSITGHTAQS